MRALKRSRPMPAHRLWAVWLALVLVLVLVLSAALAPTVSHALVWVKGSTLPTFEICTTSGPRVVSALPEAESPTNSVDSPTERELAHTLTHCPLCLHNTDRCAPPPPADTYLFLAHGGPTVPSIWQALFYSLNFYPRSAPRGPPAPLNS